MSKFEKAIQTVTEATQEQRQEASRQMRLDGWSLFPQERPLEGSEVEVYHSMGNKLGRAIESPRYSSEIPYTGISIRVDDKVIDSNHRLWWRSKSINEAYYEDQADYGEPAFIDGNDSKSLVAELRKYEETLEGSRIKSIPNHVYDTNTMRVGQILKSSNAELCVVTQVMDGEAVVNFADGTGYKISKTHRKTLSHGLVYWAVKR